MSVQPKRLAAVFYLPLGAIRGDPTELAAEAGGSDIKQASDADGIVDCLWAGLLSESRLIRSSFFGVLLISFWQSDFLQLIESGCEETKADGASAVADAFRKACVVLRPAFAFVATRVDQATEEWVVGNEWSVLNHEANRLATQGLGLIYFSPEMDDHWVPRSSQEDRDSLPSSSGRLMFASRGTSRWF
jgi:hypothetical protein